MAAGVVVRTIPPGGTAGESETSLIEIDLAAARVRPEVTASSVDIDKGRVFGDALTVKQWCERKRALVGINGGFFGVTVGARKEVVGLLAVSESIVSAGRLLRSPRNPARRFVRSVLGFDNKGMPHIGWAVGQRGRAAMLTEYLEPLNPTRQRFWTVDSAVGCGPRLIQGGRIRVTDSEERLASPPPLRRTFVGYSVESGRPHRLVLGITDSMTFEQVAEFLDRHFRKQFRTPCAEAMCLDGGASTQLVYRANGAYTEARPSVVTVPTAILVTPR